MQFGHQPLGLEEEEEMLEIIIINLEVFQLKTSIKMQSAFKLLPSFFRLLFVRMNTSSLVNAAGRIHVPHPFHLPCSKAGR